MSMNPSESRSCISFRRFSLHLYKYEYLTRYPNLEWDCGTNTDWPSDRHFQLAAAASHINVSVLMTCKKWW